MRKLSAGNSGKCYATNGENRSDLVFIIGSVTFTALVEWRHNIVRNCCVIANVKPGSAHWLIRVT